MPRKPIPKMPALLPVLSSMLLLTACGHGPRLEVPDASRAAEEPYPAIPEGELTKEQAATLIGGLADVIDACNTKLAWFGDWIAEARKKEDVR